MAGGYVVSETMIGELETLLKMITPGGDNHEDVDIGSGDHTATMTNCRFIAATTDGNIKIDYTKGDDTTGTVTLPVAGGFCSWRNVTKVYQTGTSAAGIVLCR